MEDEQADYILKCSEIFHRQTTASTQCLAYEYAIKIPESWITNELTGNDWHAGFIDRHKVLSLHCPEATSLARVTSFNKINLSIFQKQLQALYERYQFTNNDVLNLDETDCSTMQKFLKVIVNKNAY